MYTLLTTVHVLVSHKTKYEGLRGSVARASRSLLPSTVMNLAWIGRLVLFDLS